MNTLHSPAPWKKGGTNTTLQDEIEDAEGRAVAIVWTRTTTHTGKYVPSPCAKPDPKGEANMALMVAAPELLEVVEALLGDLEESHQAEVENDHYGDKGGCLYCAHIEAAKLVIAKAGGTQP